jgi:hypothetical protein
MKGAGFWVVRSCVSEEYDDLEDDIASTFVVKE